MPTIRVNNTELFYEETGSGPETIVFSHGLLMDHTMFGAQQAAFASRFRVIAYDHRGQGASSDPGSGYDMDTIAEDAATLIQALHAAPCHFAGLSMGGFAGMRLAARRPELVRTLTLMNTGAAPEPMSGRVRYNFLAQLVKIVGTRPFTSIAVKELFGKSTRASNDPAKQAMLKEWTEKLASRPKHIARALLGVMNRPAFSEKALAAIQCPTLIIAGDDDTAQPPFRSEHMARAIPNARLIRSPACGHSSSLEQPEAVIEAMRELMAKPLAANSRE
jgi:pimeloyl-ACP methyl ester carboxylesterase